MKNSKLNLIISIFICTFLTGQSGNSRSTVKSASLDDFSTAWTVEYLPYKILVQDAISKYKNLDINDKINIPIFNISDQLIIVKSLTNKNEIHQIRYGNPKLGYIILSTEEVKWVFGQTLRITLLDRDTYFYLDYNVTTSGKPNQMELDYIKNTNYWLTNDYNLDFPSKISATLFNGYYAISLHWGDEYLGLPYSSLGAQKIGIGSKFFEFGIITPSLLHFANGTITRKDTAQSLDKMSSGMGGYGRFQLSSFNGYLSFSSLPFTIEDIDTSDIYHLDFAGSITYSQDFPLRDLLPFYNGTTLLSVGFYSYHVSNGKISSSETIRNHYRAISIDNTYSYLENNEISDYTSGAYFRVDGTSKIPKGREFPRFKWAVQVHSGFSSLYKVTLNINDKVGVSTTYTKSLNDEIMWDSEKAYYFGVVYNYSKTD